MESALLKQEGIWNRAPYTAHEIVVSVGFWKDLRQCHDVQKHVAILDNKLLETINLLYMTRITADQQTI